VELKLWILNPPAVRFVHVKSREIRNEILDSSVRAFDKESNLVERQSLLVVLLLFVIII